jgi:CheY-like chemotaxis protein
MTRSNRQTAVIKNEIFIIDDVRENLHLLSTFLRQEGYCVRCSTSGKRALTAIQFARPDLILLDIMMPDMDGFEVYRLLKADSWTAKIPVIFVSALDIPIHLKQMLLADEFDYVTKPYRLEEIFNKVRAAVSK